MVKVVNELVEERGLSAAVAYSDFGLKQVEGINERLGVWLGRQSFAEDVVPSFYSSVVVEGDTSGNGRDSLTWKLEFAKPIVNNSKVDRALRDGLLHAKNRLPGVIAHGSEPHIFNTADYIHMTVRNNEGGWMKIGEFPRATTWVRNNVDMNLKTKEFESTAEAVCSEVRRDAVAGFRVAEDWAKFRAMASGCSDFVTRSLRKEWNGVKDYNEGWEMKNRGKVSTSFMLGLLPDVRARSGTTALREYYRPGFLEGTLALELERGVSQSRGGIDTDRSIYRLTGKPIEIMSTHGKGNYDARLNFKVDTYSAGSIDDDALVKKLVQRGLGKHFDVKVVSPSEFDVSFCISDANKVCCDIMNGNEKSVLHKEAGDFVDAVGGVYSAVRSWNGDKGPALEEGYKAMVKSVKSRHFEDMGKSIDSKLGR